MYTCIPQLKSFFCPSKTSVSQPAITRHFFIVYSVSSICICVCAYVCMYVKTYVCMYMCIYIMCMSQLMARFHRI